jgi:hypothetical protein
VAMNYRPPQISWAAAAGGAIDKTAPDPRKTRARPGPLAGAITVWSAIQANDLHRHGRVHQM